MSNHHFLESANFKESSISHILAEMYDLEFNEINGDLEGPSHEDDRFIKLMQDNVEMVDGHYQIPLPFKEEVADMPNNRIQAEKRLKSVRRKMEQSECFKKDYIEFIDRDPAEQRLCKKV